MEKHQRSKGRREWLTLTQLAEKHGSKDVAQKIASAKENDPEARKTHVRKNRDMHGQDSEVPWTINLLGWEAYRS